MLVCIILALIVNTVAAYAPSIEVIHPLSYAGVVVNDFPELQVNFKIDATEYENCYLKFGNVPNLHSAAMFASDFLEKCNFSQVYPFKYETALRFRACNVFHQASYQPVINFTVILDTGWRKKWKHNVFFEVFCHSLLHNNVESVASLDVKLQGKLQMTHLALLCSSVL